MELVPAVLDGLREQRHRATCRWWSAGSSRPATRRRLTRARAWRRCSRPRTSASPTSWPACWPRSAAANGLDPERTGTGHLAGFPTPERGTMPMSGTRLGPRRRRGEATARESSTWVCRPQQGSGTVRWSVLLPPRPPSVAEARRRIRDLLAGSDREDLVDTCVLLVSEVVTNALLHAGTEIELRAALAPSGVRVEVGDGSPHLPFPRGYAATSGTGRGLAMLESMVDDWGVTRHAARQVRVVPALERADDVADRPDDAPRPAHRHLRPPPQGADPTVTVDLLNMPLLLHAAWQEHVEALLREYLLANLDADGVDSDPAARGRRRRDRGARGAHPPVPGRGRSRTRSSATRPSRSSRPTVRVPVPVASRAALRHPRPGGRGGGRARRGGAGAHPADPAGGRRLPALAVPRGARPVRGRAAASRGRCPPTAGTSRLMPPGWDAAAVTEAGRGLIAANSVEPDHRGQPGGRRDPRVRRPRTSWSGRRIVSIVPPRLRQAHVAGFTMYLLVGRRPIMGAPAVVPALRARRQRGRGGAAGQPSRATGRRRHGPARRHPARSRAGPSPVGAAG